MMDSPPRMLGIFQVSAIMNAIEMHLHLKEIVVHLARQPEKSAAARHPGFAKSSLFMVDAFGQRKEGPASR
eukprot:2208965-Rhodomonas_salina.1